MIPKSATCKSYLMLEMRGSLRLAPLLMACKAISLIATGRRDEADELARRALVLQNDAGSAGFTGGHVLGASLLTTEDGESRAWILRHAQELLGQRCIAQVPLQLYRYRIQSSLDLEEWSSAEDAAHALETMAQERPAVWVDYFVHWGRALAAFGRGSRDEIAVAKLEQLQSRADQIGLGSALPALHRALALT